MSQTSLNYITRKKYNNDSTVVLNWYLAAGFILDLKDLGDLNYLFSTYIIPLNRRHYLSLQTLLT